MRLHIAKDLKTETITLSVLEGDDSAPEVVLSRDQWASLARFIGDVCKFQNRALVVEWIDPIQNKVKVLKMLGAIAETTVFMCMSWWILMMDIGPWEKVLMCSVIGLSQLIGMGRIREMFAYRRRSPWWRDLDAISDSMNKR